MTLMHQNTTEQWRRWILRNDEHFLDSLFCHPLTRLQNHKHVGPLLVKIIKALHSSPYHLKGKCSPEEKIKLMGHEFLTWLETSKEWKNLNHHTFQEKKTKFWSFPLFLSIMFLKFTKHVRDERLLEKKDFYRQLAQSSQHGDHFSWAETFTEEILYSIDELENQLPKEWQLSIRIHFEGLKEEEIQLLTGISLEKIQSHIHYGKKEMVDQIQRCFENEKTGSDS